MEKKKLLSLLSSVAGNTASYIYLLDGQPQWRTTSSSVYISIACSSCRLGLSVDQIGSHWTLIGCLCLQIGHSRDCRHCLRHISTRHLEWKAWLQYICPEPERWHKGFRSSILFDPIRSYSILSCRRNLRERWMKIRFTNFTVTPRNFFWLRLFSNTIPCENTCWSCCRDLTCPHIHTISYHDNDASSI